MEAVKKESNQNIFNVFNSNTSDELKEIIDFIEEEIKSIHRELLKNEKFLDLYSKSFSSDIKLLFDALNYDILKNNEKQEIKLKLLQVHTKNIEKINYELLKIFKEINFLEKNLQMYLTLLLIIDFKKYQEIIQKLGIENKKDIIIKKLIIEAKK